MTCFKYVFLFAAFCIVPLSAYAQSPVVPDAPVLSFQQALSQALQASPGLEASHAEALAAAAAARQSRAYPNPEISVDAESLYGQGGYKGTGAAEVTYGFSQRIEIGGKRSAKAAIADSNLSLSELQKKTAHMDLIRDVTLAYTQVAASQAQAALASEQENLAQEVHNAVSVKVEAGSEPPVQESRAAVALANARLARERAERDLEAAKQALSTYWGEQGGDFTIDKSFLENMPQPLSLLQFEERLENTPEMQSSAIAIERAASAYRLEQSMRVPDPTFGVGWRDDRGSGDGSYALSLSMPLPVWDRNSGNVERAKQERIAADRRAAEQKLATRSDLIGVHNNLVSAYREAKDLRETILVEAEKAFGYAQEGYQAGKFQYLDLLDAQRTLFETREQLAQAQADYHRERAQIERMAGFDTDVVHAQEAQVQIPVKQTAIIKDQKNVEE